MKTPKNSVKNLFFAKETISKLNFNDLEAINGGSYGNDRSYGACSPLGTSKCPPVNGIEPTSPASGGSFTISPAY